MPTCKTFEKEMLLPHVLGGWRWRSDKRRSRPEKKKNNSNASTSTTAIWDDTEKQNKKMTRHNISSLIMTESFKDASPCWLSSSCGSRNTVPLRCHWITKMKIKKVPPKLKHFHERQRQFKGGTVFKSSTNTKSSISHCRWLITGWRSSTFGICFLILLRFLLTLLRCAQSDIQLLQ